MLNIGKFRKLENSLVKEKMIFISNVLNRERANWRLLDLLLCLEALAKLDIMELSSFNPFAKVVNLLSFKYLAAIFLRQRSKFLRFQRSTCNSRRRKRNISSFYLNSSLKEILNKTDKMLWNNDQVRDCLWYCTNHFPTP